ncbi:MAG: peptidoglycan-binding protein, partial [Bacillota bacterium]
MKKQFTAVIRPMVKGLYRLIQRGKRKYRQFSVLIRKRLGSISLFKAESNSRSTRLTRSKCLSILKNKKMVIAAGAAVVVLAVTLGAVLPISESKAEAALRASLLTAAQPDATVSPALADMAESVPTLPNSTQPPAVSTEPLPTTAAEDLSTAASEVSPVPTTAPEEQALVPGCDDPRIAEVQSRLIELGYMGEDEPTNHYGYGTEYSLQLFQRKHGLQVDGLLGEQTTAVLFSDEAQPYTVKLGDRGTDVESIQEQLIELKYLKAGSTGYFGTDTETAVKSFQQRNALTVDGSVGSNTLETLYSGDAKPAKASTTTAKNDTNTKTDTKTDTKPDNTDSGQKEETPAPAPPNEASADALVEYAKNFLGTKYVHGGKSPKGFDCSGFVYYCLNQVGYKIKYMTSAGWAKCDLPKVSSMSDLQKGDIVCFKGHVGIYMGDGNMIDASSNFGGIRICKNIMSSSYWKK